MDQKTARQRLCGCYVTVPTMFHDDHELAVNLPAIRRHVRFLIEGGIKTGTGVLLAGGAAGDFMTMSLDERISVCEAVVEEANGEIPVVFGAQSTNTRELVQLAKAAERAGAEYIQVSPPFYFNHTEEDFYEYVVAAAEAADVGIIVYNTFWTSVGVSLELVDRLVQLRNMIGLKWASGDLVSMSFERAIDRFGERLSVIDNQTRFVTSHMLGARAIEVHICNHWPEWGVKVWRMLESKEYEAVQRELIDVVAPYYVLWREMESYTSGDGYIDKLCMELVGLDSSRNRPPTRDVREVYREKVREMLIACGTPRVIEAAAAASL